MHYLDVRESRGNRVEEGRVIKLPCLEGFLRKEGEGFRGVLIISNPSFLIPQNWRDLVGE